MSSDVIRRPGRPRGADRGEVLEIARREFLEHGYSGATMEAVANAARISKSSLYREYASKDALFAAVVTDWVDRGRDAMAPTVAALLAADDVRVALRALARGLQDAVLSPPVLQMRTLVAAEASRFPDIAADYVARSWERNIGILGAAFAELAKRGAIRTDAPEVAAEQFTWLALAAPLNRLTLRAGAGRDPVDRLEAIADEAVATFLARYGA